MRARRAHSHAIPSVSTAKLVAVSLQLCKCTDILFGSQSFQIMLKNANKHINGKNVQNLLWHFTLSKPGYDITVIISEFYNMSATCGGPGGRGPAICVAWSVSCMRVLRVNKWEALEFVLVQVGYKLLIWGCQHWGVACEKTIKVLSIAPTLPWRGEQRWERGGDGGRGGERMGWVWWGMWRKKEQQTNNREKKEKYN